jgi:hypothetical protein
MLTQQIMVGEQLGTSSLSQMVASRACTQGHFRGHCVFSNKECITLAYLVPVSVSYSVFLVG